MSKAPRKSFTRADSKILLPREKSKIWLAGTGSLEVYDNLKWTIRRGTSPMDVELRDNWETTDWEVLDLALVMDCTGSMEAWIDNCKTTLTAVIDKIVDQNPNLKVRVAFVGYRDFTDDEIFAIHDFTFDIDGVKSFISNQEATGGQDQPEDVAGALYRTTQLSWFPGSVRLASLVADAPTHGIKYHNLMDDFNHGCEAALGDAGGPHPVQAQQHHGDNVQDHGAGWAQRLRGGRNQFCRPEEGGQRNLQERSRAERRIHVGGLLKEIRGTHVQQILCFFKLQLEIN